MPSFEKQDELSKKNIQSYFFHHDKVPLCIQLLNFFKSWNSHQDEHHDRGSVFFKLICDASLPKGP